MRTRTLTTLAALAGLAFSTVSSAAWYAKFDGVDGKFKSTAAPAPKQNRATLSGKPKEIVVVGVNVAGWDAKAKKKVVK